MEIVKTPLAGLVILRPRVFSDPRGYFFESFNVDRFREAGLETNWAQDNHSNSARGTVRGLHFQRGKGQAKLIRCVRGAIWDVAVDIRPGSATLGQWFAEELSEENKAMCLVPVGFAHGFAVLSETADVIYKCSNVYDGKLEDGFKWDDPDVGVEWPVKEPILSERDQKAQSYREYLKSVGAGA